ncbi:hypothetical protein RI054_34g132840 [Pseudoscourfieldia marina]
MVSLPRPSPQVVLRGSTAAIAVMSAAMLAVPKHLWKFFAHGKAPWTDQKEMDTKCTHHEPDRHHKQLIRWMGVAGMALAGTVMKLTEGDDNESNQKPALQALAAFFAGRAAMCGASLAQGDEDCKGQHDNSSRMHGAVTSALAGLCLLATQDEEEEEKKKDKK